MSTRNSPTPVRVLYLIYGSARVCAKCAKLLGEDKVPHLSVKAGVDFGNYRRVGLEEPNLHEQLVISLYRIYFASVKLSSNTTGKVNFDVRSTFQGNAIMFMHNTKECMNMIAFPWNVLRTSKFTLPVVLEDNLTDAK